VTTTVVVDLEIISENEFTVEAWNRQRAQFTSGSEIINEN
jgi:hypothetical protein